MNKTDEELNQAEKMAKRYGVRMCDENGDTHGEELYCVGIEDIADIIREALADNIANAGKMVAEPVKQEPVGYAAQSVIDWLVSDERTDAAYSGINLYKNPTGNSTIPLYAAPVSAKREWVDLTDDEIEDAVGWTMTEGAVLDCRAVIAAFKEKNK